MRILIADTTWTTMPLSQDLLKSGFLLTQADTEEAFFDFITLGRQDAIILDYDRTGWKADKIVSRIRRHAPNIPMAVMAPEADQDALAEVFRAGADTVFHSGTSIQEVAARLRALVVRNAGLTCPVVTIHGATIDMCARVVHVGQTEVPLARLEYEVIEMMALHPGMTVSVENIMDQLYAWKNEPDVGVVTVYLCRIRQKLAAAGGKPDMIQTAWGQGYRMVPGDRLPGMAKVAA
ncbi:response regulator transcription factor [Actibacterium sp. 188UL27-1]|uniref:response regulator transcription factor n=1 Tax=Actibacterium sp. 188UL27-1 TaxID=2786961 RepID=UPI00195C2F45|nr:response regulator transcription factor [Actibacterium sp. 188UL27-1]MBM7066516.1 response regulator transcription factor [Actibacterium sp. 188UL27-1]